MHKALDLFRKQYQILMSTFETASSHMTAELRKMEVTLAQLPRTMDQTGVELIGWHRLWKRVLMQK